MQDSSQALSRGFTSVAVRSIVPVVLALLAPTIGKSATVSVVNDRWADGDRTGPAATTYSEYGVDSDGDGDLESAWYNSGTSATAVASAGHLMLSPAPNPATSSATWTTYFTPEATPITLANSGDSIHVKWVFKPTNVNASNTSQNLRLALVDSPAATRIAADGTPGSGAYTGYGMFMNMGQTLGNSSPFRLMERNVASGDLLATSGNWAALGTTGAASGTTGYANGTEYSFDMTLTRNATAGLDILVTMVGGSLNNTGTASVSFTDASPNSFTFDTFELRPSSATTTADTFDTTQFLVETNAALIQAPEPASLAALTGAAATLLRRRRR